MITCSTGTRNARSHSPWSRPGNSDDGYHVEQMNWAIVRTVDYHRYDTEKELLVLNMIWVSQSQMANYFCPQSTR